MKSKKNLIQRLRSKHKDASEEIKKNASRRCQSVEIKNPIEEEEPDPLNFNKEVKVDTTFFDNFKKEIEKRVVDAINQTSIENTKDNPEPKKMGIPMPMPSQMPKMGMPAGKNFFAEIMKARVRLKSVDNKDSIDNSTQQEQPKEKKKPDIEIDSDDSYSDIERKMKEAEEEKKKKQLEEDLKSLLPKYTPDQKQRFRSRIRNNLKKSSFPYYYDIKYKTNCKSKILEKAEKLKSKLNFPKYLEKKVNEIVKNSLPNPCVTDPESQYLDDEHITEIKYTNIKLLTDEEILSVF